MNHSQATDAYLALKPHEREVLCKEAVSALPCEFCQVPAGTECNIAPYRHLLGLTLDGTTHAGRWMKYLIRCDSVKDFL